MDTMYESDCSTCEFVNFESDDIPCIECCNNYALKYKPFNQKLSESILADLCTACGWQGGTIHQVIDEIIRLKKFESNYSKLVDLMTSYIKV